MPEVFSGEPACRLDRGPTFQLPRKLVDKMNRSALSIPRERKTAPQELAVASRLRIAS
jgi:hypothetical protein